ncbi:MAG TPA: zf-HC2 domain-containing protein [Thermoanaerobaculia bacterium]|jgi:anti-sigma factor RsiW|nr:zf-HC2 domain-containing protein [Thermoanaerobaculia bacterium]
MNCDEAIEFLPWLLNGTLEATERDEVQRHLATCERCRAALNDSREAWTIFGQHIPSDALVALAYDEAPAGVDPAVAERHLDTCAECAAELKLARTSRREEDKKNKTLSFFPRPWVRPEQKDDHGIRTWRGAALAASLTGLIAFGGWFNAAQRSGLVSELEAKNQAIQQEQTKLQAEVKAMQSQVAETFQPQINTPAPDLRPEEVERGGEGTEISIPAKKTVTPLLQAAPGISALERDIAILDESGKPVWQQSGLRNDSMGFTFTLFAGFLKPGHYTIQLYTTENGKRVPRESYKIRVE